MYIITLNVLFIYKNIQRKIQFKYTYSLSIYIFITFLNSINQNNTIKIIHLISQNSSISSFLIVFDDSINESILIHSLFDLNLLLMTLIFHLNNDN